MYTVAQKLTNGLQLHRAFDPNRGEIKDMQQVQEKSVMILENVTLRTCWLVKEAPQRKELHGLYGHDS
jgi:hypothetical protein